MLWSVFFVTIFFIALFFFIDFVDEMSRVGRNGYTMAAAALAALLEQPGHVYEELFPIAVLIGTIYSMARLAQSSEFTILRTAGLGAAAVERLGLLGVIRPAVRRAHLSLGEYVTPHSEQAAGFLKARFGMGLAIGRTGAWLKERRTDPDGERSITVNVRGVGKNGELDRRAHLRDKSERPRSAQPGRPTRHRAAHPLEPPRVDAAGRHRKRTGSGARPPASRASNRKKCRRWLGHHTGLEHVRSPPRPVGPARSAADDLLPLHDGAFDAGRWADSRVPVLEAPLLLSPLAALVMVALRPCLRLPACARGRRQRQGVRRHHAGHQLRPVNNVVGHLGLLHEVDALDRRLGAERGVPVDADAGACCWPATRRPGGGGWNPVGHGARDPAWATPFEAIGAHVRTARTREAVVRLSFLELMQPALADAGAGTGRPGGCSRIDVVPVVPGRRRPCAARRAGAAGARLREGAPRHRLDAAWRAGRDAARHRGRWPTPR